MSIAKRGLTPRAAKIPLVDTRGLRCPLPTLRAALALAKLPSGARLVLRADDPATVRDLPVWCREFHYHVTCTEERGGVTRFDIRKE